MTPAQRLQLEQSEKRQRINELLGKEDMTAEERTELGTLTTRMQQIEPELRAAIVVESAENEQAEREASARGEDDGQTPEERERAELRTKARVGDFIAAALKGRVVDGASAEFAAACGVGGGIPMDLWEEPERRQAEHRADAPTPAPSTVGVNLQPIRPAVFAPSVLPSLGVSMPRVASGTYAEGVITTSMTAGSKAKGAAADSTAAAITVQTATPKRISARMSIRVEDIAAIGQANFEAALRMNIAQVMSAELDDQGLNGTGSPSSDLIGMFERLTNPGSDPTQIAAWADFAAIPADHVDGLWASSIRDVAMVVGVASYALSAKVFRGADDATSAAAYLEGPGSGGWRTNARMPAPASNVQAGIAYLKGRPGMLTAVCPQWGSIQIDDIYSGSAAGERYLTLHALLGDVIVVQGGAYAEFRLKVA